jgi:hypothetical protein
VHGDEEALHGLDRGVAGDIVVVGDGALPAAGEERGGDQQRERATHGTRVPVIRPAAEAVAGAAD